MRKVLITGCTGYACQVQLLYLMEGECIKHVLWQYCYQYCQSSEFTPISVVGANKEIIYILIIVIHMPQCVVGACLSINNAKLIHKNFITIGAGGD